MCGTGSRVGHWMEAFTVRARWMVLVRKRKRGKELEFEFGDAINARAHLMMIVPERS